MPTLSIGDIQTESELIERFVQSYRKRFAAVIDGMNRSDGSADVSTPELQYLRLCIETMDMVLVNQACLALIAAIERRQRHSAGCVNAVHTRDTRILIRPAKKGDLAAAQKLEQTVFTHHAISPRQMRYLQQTPTAIFLIAQRAGELAGDAIGLIRRHSNGGQSGRIYSLVVDPNHRGQRIGQKLMARLMREFSRRRVDRIYLEVENTNHGAIRLYEQLRFQIIKPLHHYYGRGKHGVHMRWGD